MKSNVPDHPVVAVFRCCTDLQVRSSGTAYATVRESVEQAASAPDALALMADRVAVTSPSNPLSKTSGKLVAPHAEASAPAAHGRQDDKPPPVMRAMDSDEACDEVTDPDEPPSSPHDASDLNRRENLESPVLNFGNFLPKSQPTT